MRAIYITDLSGHAGESVTLKGWTANKRSGKGIYFIILRDGTGFCQCVVDEKQVAAGDFENAGKLTMERFAAGPYYETGIPSLSQSSENRYRLKGIFVCWGLYNHYNISQ